jgi:hypothetical protein
MTTTSTKNMPRTTENIIEGLLLTTKWFERDSLPMSALLVEEAAQRLRELNKPDCVWTNDDKRVDSYITGCNKRKNVRWSPYCFNCGGAVREAT